MNWHEKIIPDFIVNVYRIISNDWIILMDQRGTHI